MLVCHFAWEPVETQTSLTLLPPSMALVTVNSRNRGTSLRFNTLQFQHTFYRFALVLHLLLLTKCPHPVKCIPAFATVCFHQCFVSCKTECWALEQAQLLNVITVKYFRATLLFFFSALTLFEWWGAGIISCLERGANDLYMVQLMLPIISRLLLH